MSEPFDGWRRIRTFESVANRFTVCPLWPLGNPSLNRSLLYMKQNQIARTFFKNLKKLKDFSCSREFFINPCNFVCHFFSKIVDEKAEIW